MNQTKIAVPFSYIYLSGLSKRCGTLVKINITIPSIIRFKTQCQANKHHLILSFER